MIPPLPDVFTPTWIEVREELRPEETPPCAEVDDSDPALTAQTVVYKLLVSVVSWPPCKYVSVVYTVEVKEADEDVG